MLAKFAKYLKETTATEIRSLRARAIPGLQDAQLLGTIRYWLQSNVDNIGEKERIVMNQALHSSQVLSTIYSMRQDLAALWSSSTASKEQLVNQLKTGASEPRRAASVHLQEFSRKLRCYD